MTTSTSRRFSGSDWQQVTRSGTVRVGWSTRAAGDFHLERVDPVALERRRRSLVDLPWTMLDQVHGTDVVEVDRPGDADRHQGDVAVTGCAGAALGVWVGDCAPVVLVADSGRFAVVHGGWRGLGAGVLDSARRALADAEISAYLGPCIGPCCYEFDGDELASLAGRLGLATDAITGETSWGTPALDVPGVVRSVLSGHGIDVCHTAPCTGCGGEHFSHRMRSDLQRHVVVAWKVP